MSEQTRQISSLCEIQDVFAQLGIASDAERQLARFGAPDASPRSPVNLLITISDSSAPIAR